MLPLVVTSVTAASLVRDAASPMHVASCVRPWLVIGAVHK